MKPPKIKMPCCSKSLPTLVHVDDILFRKPVEIGSLLYFSSQVVYTQGHYVMVRVSAEVVQPEDGTHDLTNVFHFTLKTDSLAPEVIPRTYQGNKSSSRQFFLFFQFMAIKLK
jgi:acyl-coenzyme A thioesterase 9